MTTGSIEQALAQIGELKGIMAERRVATDEGMRDIKSDIRENKDETNKKLDSLQASTDKKLDSIQASTNKKVDDLDKKVDDIRDIIMQTQGGWKVLVALVAFAGAVGALLAKVPWEKFLPGAK